MDATTLIDELRGENPIAGLKKFVETVEGSSDRSAIVNDLLTVSPNCNDILQLLPKYNQDKKDLAVIFNSLGYVLMSIAKELPSFGSVGLHITRWILQNHCNLLHKLLVNVSQNTCTALHCITGMVRLGSAATFEVLSHLEFNSIKFGLLAEKRDETKLRDIRSCLFSLIFAFLTCEDCKCLRKVVRHHEMFTCVFRGLEHDPSIRIIRFLTYLRESIVLDAFIQKTTKIQIFNERTCKYLVKFYFHKDDNYNKNVDEDRDPEDKRIIKQALHNLMISLCSDLRYGVIFKDKKNNEANNKIVFYILTTINSPWEFEEGRELTNKILKACPDITKLFLNFISSYLEERPTLGYFSILKLFALIIDTQTPLDTVEMQAEKGPLKEICFLTPFVNKKLILSLMENNSRILRHAGSLILLALFRKTKETLAEIGDIQRLTDNQKQALKNAVLICVEKIIKPIKFVCCWEICLKEDFNSSPIWYRNLYKSKFEFLSTLTEMICIYAEMFDFQSIREFINPLNMLRKLLELPKEEMTTDMVSYQTCLEHVLSILLTGQKLGNFESFGFLKEEGADDGTILLNKYLFKQLISIYCLGNYNPGTNNTEISLKLQDICLSLLDASFSRWGLSLYCESYYKIWLDKIILKEFEKCSDFLAEVIIRTVSNQFAYLDILINQKEGKENNMECIDVLSEVEKVNTLEVNDNEDMTVFSVTIPFSCLVVGASEVLKENPDEYLIRYFSSIVEEYIHCLPDPKSLGNYLLANEELISLTLKQYLLVWVSNEPVDDIQLNKDDNLSDKLKYIFMTKQYPSSSSEFCKEIKSSLIDEKDLEQLCRQVLLYVQNEKKKVDLKKKKSLKFYLKVLRSLITTNEDELEVDRLSGLLKYLLHHSFILESYGMFCDSNIISSEVENIIFTVILKYPSLHYLLKPYLKKLFVALDLCLSKEEGQNIDYLIHISPYLDHYSYISYADIEHMLTTCLTSPQSSETISNLINELFLLLLKSSTKYHRPSTKIIKMAFSKLVVLNQNKVTMKYFSEFVANYMVASFFSTLKHEDFLQLLKCRPIDGAICDSLLKGYLPHVNALAKRLKTLDTDLPSQAPLIASLLKVKPSLVNVQAYLKKVKDDILQWALSEESEMNNDYQLLLDHMLQNRIINASEVTNICNSWYTSAVSSISKAPAHIVSISPAFRYLAKEKTNDDTKGSISSNLQLLCLCLSRVAYTYGKPHDQNSLEIVKLILLLLPEIKSLSIQEELQNKQIWSSFAKKVLKHSYVDKENGPLFLECLIQLCKIVYINGNSKESILPVATFCQMLRGHTQFGPLMLGRDKDVEQIKEQVVKLQIAIAEIDINICEERHIPLLLGSYGATRSSVDQYILKLLCLYECSGNMTSHELNLWGTEAIRHFAKSEEEEIPPVKHHQTLALLDSDMVIQTAVNFDMALGLEPCSLSEPDHSLYDQRFLLLLFLNITDDELQVDVMELVEKGIYALGIAALSSHCEEVWAIGATILQNMTLHFENSSHRNLKNHWIWFAAIIGYGLEGATARIPSLLVHFLIRVTQLFLNPSDNMYRSVMNYIFLRSSVALFKVPELLVFFFSDDTVRHRDQKIFLLELLASGMRDSLDISVCEAGYVPKFILGMMTSLTINTRIRVLSLNVLKSMVSIQEGAVGLAVQKSLLTQLPLALEANVSCPLDDISYWIQAVLEVLESLWSSWTKSNALFHAEPIQSTIHPLKQNRNKRKLQTTNEEQNDTSFKKKRKTNIGSAITEVPKTNDRRLEKEKTKLMSYITEFLVCLGKVVPKVVPHGMLTSVSNCFNLLSEVVTAIDKLNFTLQPCFDGLNITIFDTSLIRHQVLSWIDETQLLRRFPGSLTDKDLAFISPHQSIRQEWKQCPLRRDSTNENGIDEDLTESENDSEFSLLLESTRKLFTILYMQDNVH